MLNWSGNFMKIDHFVKYIRISQSVKKPFPFHETVIFSWKDQFHEVATAHIFICHLCIRHYDSKMVLRHVLILSICLSLQCLTVEIIFESITNLYVQKYLRWFAINESLCIRNIIIIYYIILLCAYYSMILLSLTSVYIRKTNSAGWSASAPARGGKEETVAVVKLRRRGIKLLL